MAFSREELSAIVVLGVLSGIILSFSDAVLYQAGHVVVTSEGIAIMIVTIVGMVFSVFLHEAAHRWCADRIGYYTHVQPYYTGQILGIVIALFSFGWIQFFTPNTGDLEANPQARIHKHRKYENFKQQAFIAAGGILATALFATVLHGAWILTGSQLMRNLMMGNVLLMVYSLIPFELFSLYLLKIQQSIEQIPQSDGLYILHYSVVAYVFAGSFAIALACVLAFTTSVPVWVAIVISLFSGSYVWVKFFLES
jgi:hypothetical protein